MDFLGPRAGPALAALLLAAGSAHAACTALDGTFKVESLEKPDGMGRSLTEFASDKERAKLFKREEGITFEDHVRHVRVARAKQMLTSTSLSVERVGKLSGFAGRSHFQRVFKEAVGSTPLAYRHSRRR